MNQLCKATAIGASIAISTTNAFVSYHQATRTQLPTTRAAISINNPLSNYTPSRSIQLYAASDDDAKDNEIERLKQMAAKLRAEAASLEAEKAQQLADAAEKAFQKFDINSDGEVSLSELKTGLEKELKVCICMCMFLVCTYYLMLYLTQYISLQSIP